MRHRAGAREHIGSPRSRPRPRPRRSSPARRRDPNTGKVNAVLRQQAIDAYNKEFKA